MLVEFSFSNYKCFKDEAVLNLVAANTKNKDIYSHTTGFKYNVLKTLAVYGANASGKTKLFEALKFMKSMVCPPKRGNSPDLDYWQSIYDPFRLNTELINGNSVFSVLFIVDNLQYRYALDIDREKIRSEKLFVKKQREVNIFKREGDEWKCNQEYIKPETEKLLLPIVSPNVPFLSVLATFNQQFAQNIVKWFNDLQIISNNDLKQPISALNNEEVKQKILGFLKGFDINIENLVPNEISYDEIPDNLKRFVNSDNLPVNGKLYNGVRTTHKLYNEFYENTGTTDFSLDADESFGTNRLFGMSWPIINALQNDSVLLIDEFDSSIHPNVLKKIVSMFYDCNTKSQLIINTQNSSLLKNDTKSTPLFTKDQVYVVNKNRWGESSLSSWSEYNDLRNNMERIYLEGNLEGVPYIEDDYLLNLMQK